jgi:hypothetical protein
MSIMRCRSLFDTLALSFTLIAEGAVVHPVIFLHMQLKLTEVHGNYRLMLPIRSFVDLM